MAEQFAEAIDPRIPQAFVLAEPMVGALQRSWIDAAVVDAPADGALDESGSFQRLDVLRSRSKRHPIGCSELSHGVLARGESREHGTPSVVAQRTEDGIESFVIMLNHEVEYTTPGLFVNQLVEYLASAGRGTRRRIPAGGGPATCSARQ